MLSAEDNGLWKALGDPTRRALLDHLRAGPRTTGALCAEFDMSRFGVMKHLKQLEDAGLVLVRRQGRQRFNHLNAVPIERIAQRWMGRLTRDSAQRLLALEAHLDQSREQDTMSNQPTFSFHIEQSITLNAPPQRVWRAITHEIESWWGFHIGPNDSKITLEPRVGGHFIERWGDGEGELYATVTFMRTGKKITLEGGMGLGGPGVSKFSYALEAKGEGTELQFNHYCHGAANADVEASFREGWAALLGESLPAWVHEGKVAEPA